MIVYAGSGRMLCLLTASLAAALAAQEQPDVLIRTETRLALVRFHVVRGDRYVEDLDAEKFELLEDGKPVKIALFESAGTRSTAEMAPLEVFVVLDVSNSVVNMNLLDPILLKQTFLDGIGPRSSIAVYAFGNHIRCFTKPTSNPVRLKAALQEAYDFAHGGSRVFDAIVQVSREAVAGSAGVSRLLVILSDGLDTSKTKPRAAIDAAQEAGIPLYPVLLGHDRVLNAQLQVEQQVRNPGRRGGMDNPRQAERQARMADHETMMREFFALGEKTGGRGFDPAAMNGPVLNDILQGLVGQIRAEYVIGFYPPPSDGEAARHKVQVRLLDKRAGKLRGGTRTVVH